MRARLALLVVATMAVVLVGFLVPLAVLVRSVAADRAVTGATTEAQSVVGVVATTDRAGLRLAVDQINANTRHPVTVFLPDGSTVGAPATSTDAVLLASRGSSLTVAVPGGREILVAVQGLPDGTAVVRTFTSDAELRRGVDRAWLVLGLLGLVLLGLGAAVADPLARSVAGPVRELARVSHRLAAGDLEARAEPSGPPEVREVAGALNHLAGRIRELVWQEREAVADLSHRLRTPLTALRLDAEALADPVEAVRIGAHAHGLELAVTALIEDARRRGGEPASCDAAAVVAARVAFWAVLAEDQDRAVLAEVAQGPVPVGLAEGTLAACVDALLGNVFAHTPDGTAFTVRLSARATGGAELVVEDAGPGFGGPVDRPDPLRPDPLRPGPLRRGVSGGGSTGLGLDIVRQAAQTGGGTVVLGHGPGGRGARVTVQLA